MTATFAMTINGSAYPITSSFEIQNPATGGIAGRAPNATLADLDQAVASAQAAFETWSKTTDAERADALNAIAQKLGEHSEELAALITKEQGKPLNGVGSRFEMGGVGAWTTYTASLTLPVKVLQDNNEGRVEMHRKPLGVVGVNNALEFSRFNSDLASDARNSHRQYRGDQTVTLYAVVDASHG